MFEAQKIVTEFQMPDIDYRILLTLLDFGFVLVSLFLYPGSSLLE